ncbi:hypothetical protein LCGC14_1797350 [marine sediment metagenome]|uniref:Uncharacterized protein n=1 Tax=marine sediment metagenome TaxID=412755 RepID=A0A0F9GQR6_9ZZZZ
MNEILISIVTYNNSKFDVIFRDNEGNEVTLSGEQEVSEEELEFINNIAPACVWTRYRREK